MRSVVACSFAVLFGTASTLAMSALAMAADYSDDNDMSYARVTQVAPIYAIAAYDRGLQREDGYRRVYADRRFCATVADGAYREEVVAYRVYYRYHGHDLVREMAYDPGSLLKVHANIETDD